MSRLRMTSWDSVVTSAPLNKDAAIARDGRGESWEPDSSYRITCERAKAPFETRLWPRITDKQFNLTGQKFGDLTVIGLAAKKSNAGARFVVRCVCGWYEYRSAKALKAAGVVHCCAECTYVKRLKAGVLTTPQKRKERRERKALGKITATEDQT